MVVKERGTNNDFFLLNGSCFMFILINLMFSLCLTTNQFPKAKWLDVSIPSRVTLFVVVLVVSRKKKYSIN